MAHVLVARPRFTRTVTEEEVQRALSEAVTLCEQSGGFHAFYCVRVSDREVMNISFWDSQDAERGFAAARPSMTALAGAMMEGPPEQSSGDLIFTYRVEQGTAAG